MRVFLKLLRRQANQSLFNFKRRLPLGDSRAVRHSKDVGVHGDGRFSERGVQYYVCGLAPNTGQRLEFGARSWHLTAVVLD